MSLHRVEAVLFLSVVVVAATVWSRIAPEYLSAGEPAAAGPVPTADPTPVGADQQEAAGPDGEDISYEKEAASKYAAQMADLDNQALLDLVALDGELATQIDDLTIAVDEALFSQINAVEFVNLAVAEVEAVESPYSEAFLEAAHSGQLLKQIKDNLAQLKEGELPEPATLSIRARWGPPAETEDTETTLAHAAREERRRVKGQQGEARRLLDYFNRLGEKWKDFQDIVLHRNSATSEYADQLAQLIDLELKRMAAVREIEKRVGDGKLAADQVSQEVLDSVDPQVLQDLFASRREFRERQKTAKQTDARIRQRVEMHLLWRAWSEILSLNVDSRVPLTNRAVTQLSAATVPREELEEFERRSIEFRSQETHKASKTRTDALLSMLLSPEERERFESGLAFYYLELEDANRRIAEYQAAAASYEELIEKSAQLRDAMEGSPDDLGTALAVRFGELTRARFMAAIAAHPEWQQRYVDEYARLGQSEFPLPQDEQPGDVDFWAHELLVAQARWRGQQRWREDIEFLLSRLGVVADVARLREHAAEIQVQLAATESRAKSVQELIASLSSDYRNRMQANALNNLIQLLAIPVVALILSFLVQRFCRRLGRKKAGQTEGDADRARRLGTLARTASGTLNTLIWLVALIYMLKLTGLDVTPIVASASIAGLAVAFAAQSLLKDMFCGFFILWENQYSVDDYVDIDGATGFVEKITMRSTKLRDMDGIVFYIPNGSVKRVRNLTQDWGGWLLIVRVGYESDLDHVNRVLAELLEETARDPKWGEILLETPTVDGVHSLSDDSVEIRLTIKTKPGKQWGITREIRARIKTRFDKEGIRIPVDARFLPWTSEEARKLMSPRTV